MNIDFLYGIAPIGFWGYVLVTFLCIQVMLLGITLYLHRDQAHGGLELHPAVRHFFRFWLWFSSGTVTKQWVAVHRRHHAYSDKDGDPHSPIVFGLKKVLTQGYELYVVAARDKKICDDYGRGTPDDWMERNVYSRYPTSGIVLMSIIALILFGIPAIVMVTIQLMAQPVLAAGVINGLGHHTGYRSFEVDSAATNIYPWAVLVAGEELHNNHHAFPSSARFDVQPWEFDIGWQAIRVLRFFGLAKVIRVAPRRPVLAEAVAPVTPNPEMLTAIITHRMHVLRDYQRRVLAPVFRELRRERGKAALPGAVKRLLVRHPQLLDEAGAHRVRTLLDEHAPLRVVADLRQRLQEIWDGAAASPAHRLEALKAWCNEAERSGIRALEAFAVRLRAYAMVPTTA